MYVRLICRRKAFYCRLHIAQLTHMETPDGTYGFDKNDYVLKASTEKEESSIM